MSAIDLIHLGFFLLFYYDAWRCKNEVIRWIIDLLCISFDLSNSASFYSRCKNTERVSSSLFVWRKKISENSLIFFIQLLSVFHQPKAVSSNEINFLVSLYLMFQIHLQFELKFETFLIDWKLLSANFRFEWVSTAICEQFENVSQIDRYCCKSSGSKSSCWVKWQKLMSNCKMHAQ